MAEFNIPWTPAPSPPKQILLSDIWNPPTTKDIIQLDLLASQADESRRRSRIEALQLQELQQKLGAEGIALGARPQLNQLASEQSGGQGDQQNALTPQQGGMPTPPQVPTVADVRMGGPQQGAPVQLPQGGPVAPTGQPSGQATADQKIKNILGPEVLKTPAGQRAYQMLTQEYQGIKAAQTKQQDDRMKNMNETVKAFGIENMKKMGPTLYPDIPIVWDSVQQPRPDVYVGELKDQSGNPTGVKAIISIDEKGRVKANPLGDKDGAYKVGHVMEFNKPEGGSVYREYRGKDQSGNDIWVDRADLGGKLEETNEYKDFISEQMKAGKTKTQALKAWADLQEKRIGTRGEAFAKTRGVSMYDTQTESLLEMSWADINEANKAEKGRFIPAAQALPVMQKQAVMKEISTASQIARTALTGLKKDFDTTQRAQFAKVLNDPVPMSALDAFIRSSVGRTLTPDQVEYMRAMKVLCADMRYSRHGSRI
jgi:hypothetical protein